MALFSVCELEPRQGSLFTMVRFSNVLALLGAVCLYVLVICTHASSSTDTTSVIFNGFDGQNISLSGVAEIDDGLLKLTDIKTLHRFGRAFYPYAVYMKNTSTNLVSSFSTSFVFCITPLLPGLAGHGLAFVMSPSLHTSDVSPSQYLGMLNASNNGNASNHVFGVEFDTIQNLEVMDINDNHVGVNLNSMISTNSSAAGYWPAASSRDTLQNDSKTLIDLKSGEIIQAWIEYDGHSQQLNVTIAPLREPKPLVPLLSVGVNLSDVLQEYVFVGFSSATGIISSTHRVLSWSFNSNGVAKSLDLSSLPSITPKTPLLESTRFKAAISTSVVISSLLLGFGVALILYKRSQREVVETWELEFGLHRYSYKELKKATRRFHNSGLLGVGGFGRVYKGVLPHSGLEVAVKRLSSKSAQGEREFIAEIASTGRLRHRNLVQLIGWSRHKGELLLVYEFMPNGSLDKMLFVESGKVLRWEQRLKIITGVAAGLLYLHEGWEQQVLHRDVKASNVLLDAEMNGRLGDFGLARLYEHGKNPHTTRVVGTLGYLAPEFGRTGKATARTDVFSFGVLLLEVITGRRPIEHHTTGQGNFLLVGCVWDLHMKGRLFEAVDVKLEGLFDAEEAEKVLLLGLQCLHLDPSTRPTMRQVLQILASGTPLPSVSPWQANHISPQHENRLKSTADEDLISFLSGSSIKSWSTLDVSSAR